ncbi:MAG: YdeI/OmpD-associated family protein [Anaerolineales bacterium]
MSIIRFETAPIKIGDWTILKLPGSASAKLPSRGMALVEGTINGFPSKIVLEPDGAGSHWFRVDFALRKAARINSDDAVTMEFEPSKEWPEPDLPADLKKALASDKDANALWVKITPMARWDWLRWVRATNNRETRDHRIEVALSKLKSGERRPCCFNRNQCTEPEVSKNGVLIGSAQATKQRSAY